MSNDNDEDDHPEAVIKYIAAAFALVLIGCLIAIALIVLRWGAV